MRTLLEQATESQLDGQARISIPRDLLRLAGIENDVLILGVLERLELWSPDIYKEYQKSQEESYESVAQTVLQK